MSKAPLSLAAASLLLALGAANPAAAEQATAGTPAPTEAVVDTADDNATAELARDTRSEDYRQAIKDLESNQGAYADQLSEYLLSLGLSLQQSGAHQDAIDAFKRGVHLARINDGLYSARQIPLLQREIASHMALGQYAVPRSQSHRDSTMA